MDKITVRPKRIKKNMKKGKPVFNSKQLGQIRSLASKVQNKAVETKFYDRDDIGVKPLWNNSGKYLEQLVTPAQGIADQQRIGDTLYLKSIQWRIDLAANILGQLEQVVRVIIFQDIAGDVTTQPALSNILQATFAGTSNIINAPYAHDFKSTYKILFDKTYMLQKTNDYSTIDSHIITKGFRRKLQFSGGSTDVVAGQVYIMAVSNRGTDAPGFSYVARSRFTDS